ncbi:HPr-rel-A system PqqD family peptide chaperone [Chitinimonas sp. BJB300]|uniref:HPr-rel-A system PqqD family peptide chaperone n=1 Tax=Chitinimonas sp. BJB300 TaxID=1559339 RepID=UPI00130417D3|nr:HPr-rel-A system PqqD family peptide chaperone [Chitinimonas sp. BJB300]
MHQALWFTHSSFPLEIRSFDEDCLVFHPGAGDTFVLDAFSGFLLSLLSPAAQDGVQLTSLVAAGLGVAIDQSLHDQVDGCLSDLYGLGLIECDTQ